MIEIVAFLNIRILFYNKKYIFFYFLLYLYMLKLLIILIYIEIYLDMLKVVKHVFTWIMLIYIDGYVYIFCLK